MKTLYSKLILGFLASIIVSFSFAGYFGLKKYSESLQELSYSRLTSVADALKEEVAAGNHNNLDNLANASGVGIVLIDKNGAVHYYGQDVSVLDLEDTKKEWLSSRYRQNDTDYMYKVNLEGGSTAYLKKSSLKERMIFEQSTMIALGGIFICGSMIFLIIADVIVKPIKRLTKATNSLAQGNYNVQVHYYGKDELAALSDSFNQMAKRLVKTEENRQKFISDVSHEFQTPLTSIQGFAKILTAEQVSDEQRRRYGNIILEQSMRLSTLSKSMMQLTLLEGEDIKLEKKKYSLINQLERVIEMQMGYAREQKVDIVTEFPKTEVMISADENRMEQVFINLINNAVKYTLEGGVVTVSVKKALKDIEVIIEDTGIGMSKEALERIFDRFYRADKSRSIKGNGLGLSIVKRIIDLHEFKISVESQPDVGSVFKVIIPVKYV